MIRILAVFERDLRRILRNPLALLSSVVLPLVYLFILGNSLQGPIKHLRLGVAVEDQGAASRALMGALESLQNGPRSVELVAVTDEQQGHEDVRTGRLAGMLVIPERFSSDVERGLSPSVGLFLDNVDAIASNALTGAVDGALRASSQTLRPRLEVYSGPPQLRTEELFPRVDYDASLIPGVVVMSLFMGSLLAGAFNIVMDRFTGIHESYLSTPLRKSDIALGVLLSGTCVTCFSAGVVLLVGMLSTRMPLYGGVKTVLALIVVLPLAGLGLLAMMMSLLGRASHPRTTGVLSGFVSVILFFPSGALYPIESFPGWLRAFAHVNPETHAVSALRSLLFRGGDLGAAFPHLLYLAGFTGVMLVTAVLTLKRTL